jgi:predicted nucleotidyltransferase
MNEGNPLRISNNTKEKLLAFVDRFVPRATEVWLTGSRIRGNARPDSDWDIVAFTDRAPSEPEKLFESNQLSDFTVEGGIIELVIAHPDHRNDPRPYMTELRQSGLRLR